jgi:hypothetical protein
MRHRRQLLLAGWLLLAACGYVRQDEPLDIGRSLRSLKQLYGPPRTEFAWSSLAIDLNDDGVPEQLVVVWGDVRNSPELHEPSRADLEGGLYCEGFVVFTKLDNVWWPVIYQWNDYGEHLRLARMDHFTCPQLVDDGLDGAYRCVGFDRRRWGWDDTSKAEFGAAIWDASVEKRDVDNGGSLRRYSIPLIEASWGK